MCNSAQILIDARKSPFETVTIGANAVLNSLHRLLGPLVPENIHLTITPLEKDETVEIDVDQMVTSMTNLILNTVNAMPQGGRLELAAQYVTASMRGDLVGNRMLKNGPFIAFTVADSGSGIPKEILPFVADPFFTTKPVGKGTGLGLSMAVSVAERLVGGLELLTGEFGTEVKVYIPVQA